METNICGVTFKKVNDTTIAVYQGVQFLTNIEYPAKTEEEFINSANFYFMHCW